MRLNDIISLSLIILLSILLLFKGCENSKLKFQNQQLETSYNLVQLEQESKTFVIDSLTAHSQVLQQSNLQLLEDYDQLKLSKRKPIYITNYKDKILFDTLTSTKVVYRDTSLFSLPSQSLPQYVGEYSDEWIAIKSTSDAFSTSYELAVFNDISLTHTKKSRFLRSPVYEVFAKSHSPYSVNPEVKSLTIPTKPYLFIAPALTISYDPLSSKIVPGIGLSFSYSNTTLKIPLKK